MYLASQKKKEKGCRKIFGNVDVFCILGLPKTKDINQQGTQWKWSRIQKPYLYTYHGQTDGNQGQWANHKSIHRKKIFF